MTNDTIFAPASGFGRAAVAVIRLSGPGVRGVLETLGRNVPEPRRLSLRTLRDPVTGEPIDQALVAFMPGPNSFTGEDQAEIHGHGGVAVRTALLRALAALPCCRAAEPGEFTRRAFLNGRMDLPAVEGLADLVDAETEAQRRQALRHLEGALGSRVEAWRSRLIDALADCEAALDFSDEGDVPDRLEERAAGIAAEVLGEVRLALSEGSRGERLRDGYRVVIAGPPNAGKSTLLNAIARRDVAIVSPVAGTTRDSIEVRCDLGGLPVLLVDTAGLRETDDLVEREGVARARSRLRDADFVLWLEPPDGATEVPPPGTPLLRVATKSDLRRDFLPPDAVAVSAATGAGLGELMDLVRSRAEADLGTGDAVLTRERHRAALARVADALDRVRPTLAAGRGELAAEDVRLALRALGEITGRVDVEEVLDRLFSTFCIGK
jgi:tRNA modification GTPase